MKIYIRQYKRMANKNIPLADYSVEQLVGYLFFMYPNNPLNVLRSIYLDMKIGEILFSKSEVIITALLSEG